jgi:hypothetical protein
MCPQYLKLRTIPFYTSEVPITLMQGAASGFTKECDSSETHK